MKTAIGGAALIAFFALTLILAIPGALANTLSFTSTATQSVTGYAVPTGTGLGNGLVAFILPIVITGLFLMLAGGLRLTGQVNSFIIKLSLFLGSLVGMIGLTAANTDNVPIGLTLVTGTYLITYVWKRV